jgi:hypothetical protein
MKKRTLREELELLGADYIKLLLEVKHGCRVHPIQEQTTDQTMEVWSPKGYEKATALMRTVREDCDTIAILYARVINGRKVPVVVQYHLIKVCGEDGAWSLDDSVFQQILLDQKYNRLVQSEDGSSLYAECSRELLLDQAIKIDGSAKPGHS